VLEFLKISRCKTFFGKFAGISEVLNKYKEFYDILGASRKSKISAFVSESSER
jgi:hypothetical protein